MHIASLEAHAILNTYNLWKLALRGHLGTFWSDHKNNAVTARSQLIKIFLSKSYNKSQLIKLLSTELIKDGNEVSTYEEEADTINAKEALEIANTQNSIVVADDTDVLFHLICHLYDDMNGILYSFVLKKLPKLGMFKTSLILLDWLWYHLNYIWSQKERSRNLKNCKDGNLLKTCSLDDNAKMTTSNPWHQHLLLSKKKTRIRMYRSFWRLPWRGFQ